VVDLWPAQHCSWQVILGPGQQIRGIVDRGNVVPVGMERAIDFELPDHEGNTWTLAGHLARGPVLLVFYRGDW
jgi:hypothetical protein